MSKSHLLQMRGLKRDFCHTYSLFEQSHLLQMRGLKLLILQLFSNLNVASFTDAWIETAGFNLDPVGRTVASFTDAWIETHLAKARILRARSHLLQMRGLKP